MPTPFFSTYSSTITYLDARGIFRMNPSQNNMLKVLQNSNLKRPPFLVAQVVGTNGKGSTSSMLSSICSAHTLKTGLFTSPHFISPRERVRINSEIISEKAWLKHANSIMEYGGEILSYFEFVTVLALSYFTTEGVDVAVMEAGLGGTWDATSAIDSDITVITSIGFDHCTVLGETLTEIARDKCGAIREGVPVCTTEQEDEVWQVLTKATANTKLCLSKNQLLPSCIEDESTPMLLQGQFQKKNAKLAVTAWKELAQLLLNKYSLISHTTEKRGSSQEVNDLPNTHGKTPEKGFSLFSILNSSKKTEEFIAMGLSKAWIAGRMQQVPSHTTKNQGGHTVVWPDIIIDGGHNESGVIALSQSLSEKNIIPLAVIFSCLSDKNPEKIIPHIKSLAKGLIFIPPIFNQRAIAPQILADMVGPNAIPTTSIQEALDSAITHVNSQLSTVAPTNNAKYGMLICGSLYLLGDFFAIYPNLLNPTTAIK